MLTKKELVDRLAEWFGTTDHEEICAELGVGTSTIDLWLDCLPPRDLRDFFKKASKELNIELGYMFIWHHAQVASDPEIRAAWQRVADLLPCSESS